MIGLQKQSLPIAEDRRSHQSGRGLRHGPIEKDLDGQTRWRQGGTCRDRSARENLISLAHRNPNGSKQCPDPASPEFLLYDQIVTSPFHFKSRPIIQFAEDLVQSRPRRKIFQHQLGRSEIFIGAVERRCDDAA